MSDFDPDAAAPPGSGLFGLPAGEGPAAVRVLPVPFDATTSYRQGAAGGPESVIAASLQVDLFDVWTGEPYREGIRVREVDTAIEEWNRTARESAEPVIAAGGTGGDPELERAAARVDAIAARLNEVVEQRAREALDAGELPCVLGGDHSVPFGAISACSAAAPGMGILHIDAHADLREAFEGFEWSHASIMHNVLERLPGVARIAQIGVRDLGRAENERILASPKRIRTVFDRDLARARFETGGELELMRGAIDFLPRDVYVSFDIDGLDPALCPNTGTPVPGGLDWQQAMMLLEQLVASGRRIVGMDLCEVSPGASGDPTGSGIDAIVGARLLYRLIGFGLLSRRN